MSSSDNTLKRAHQLSVEGSALSAPANADVTTLQAAQEAYTEAADLYEAAMGETVAGNQATLRMLMRQNRSLARDMERRVVARASVSSSPASPHSPASRNSTPRSSTPIAGPSKLPPTGASTAAGAGPSVTHLGMSVRRASGAGVGLSAGNGPRPGLVHATSPPRVPPFSLGPVDTQTHTDTTPATGLISPLRDMYSSSSSSEPPEGSYLLPSASADPQDPYARFWARLENMLEDISLPRALATAPLDVLKGPPSPPRVTKSKGRNRIRSPSPSESFYVVPRGRGRGDEASGQPTPKTLEELMLENESLRASLDALAVHTHQLELEKRSLAHQAEEREKLVRSVVGEVRQEAQKVRHDQELVRSQMLASGLSLAPVQTRDQPPASTVLKKRVGELEEQIRHLKEENTKLKTDNGTMSTEIQKWREKWDKLKAKKEAKVNAAKMARGP